MATEKERAKTNRDRIKALQDTEPVDNNNVGATAKMYENVGKGLAKKYRTSYSALHKKGNRFWLSPRLKKIQDALLRTELTEEQKRRAQVENNGENTEKKEKKKAANTISNEKRRLRRIAKQKNNPSQ